MSGKPERTTGNHDLLDGGDAQLLDGDGRSSALVVGPLSEPEREQIARAAQRAGVGLLSCPTITAALARLRKGQGTLSVLVAPQIDLGRMVEAVRDQAEL